MRGTLNRATSSSIALVAAIAAASLLSACASPQPKSMVKKTSTKEYFAESEYGVKASPRVTSQRSRLPRGGGRDQVGRPYKIKGKWYYPKEQPGYSKKGRASWYGDAFHGRLTANGEIYDMTHLTAAHPTMPLPSYARVTNLKNGASVMVRVNDRGPYAHGRIIDLSKRAAEMLDYTHSGIADVRVDYVGRAPLEGRDDEYLLASYKPGNAAPDPSDGMPTGVLVAMAGPTPSAHLPQGVVAAAAFPGAMTSSGAPQAASPPSAEVDALDFPEYGPVIADRPVALRSGVTRDVEALSYAERRLASASGAFDALESGSPPQDATSASWKSQEVVTQRPHIAVGTFADEQAANNLSRTLSAFGRADVERSDDAGATWYAVSLYADGRNDLDALLERSWASGAADAFIVRD